MDSRGGSLKDIEKRLLQYRRGSRGGSEELAEIDVTDASRGSGLTPWVNGTFSAITLTKESLLG